MYRQPIYRPYFPLAFTEDQNFNSKPLLCESLFLEVNGRLNLRSPLCCHEHYSSMCDIKIETVALPDVKKVVLQQLVVYTGIFRLNPAKIIFLSDKLKLFSTRIQ